MPLLYDTPPSSGSSASGSPSDDSTEDFTIPELQMININVPEAHASRHLNIELVEQPPPVVHIGKAFTVNLRVTDPADADLPLIEQYEQLYLDEVVVRIVACDEQGNTDILQWTSGFLIANSEGGNCYFGDVAIQQLTPGQECCLMVEVRARGYLRAAVGSMSFLLAAGELDGPVDGEAVEV
ncbi:hypothetical protein VTN96DRAFT_9462 [Rasamsonia emersonii]